MRSSKIQIKNGRNAIVRSRARELLFSGGNYITLIFAMIISLLPVMLVYVLSAIVSEYTYEWVFFTFLLGLEFLVGAPMLLGTVNVAVALYRRSEAPLSEMFFAFTSPGTYVRSLCLVLIQLLKLVVELAPALTVCGMIEASPLPVAVERILQLLFAVISVTVMKALLSRFYGILFFAFDSDEPRVMKAVAESWHVCKGRTAHTVTLRLCHLPLFLVSVIPMGLPLLLYTLPFMLCSYVYAMAHITEAEPSASTPEVSESTAPETINEEIIENGDINNE